MSKEIIVIAVCALIGGGLLYLLLGQSMSKDLAKDPGKRWASVLLSIIFFLGGRPAITFSGIDYFWLGAVGGLFLNALLPSDRKWANQLGILACLLPILLTGGIIFYNPYKHDYYSIFARVLFLLFFAYLLSWRVRAFEGQI
jgi:uncharacterized membrane protein